MLDQLSTALGDRPELVAAVLMLTLATIAGTVIALGIVWLVQWGKLRQVEARAAVVQKLLDKGVPAAEVAQIVFAVAATGSSSAEDRSKC